MRAARRGFSLLEIMAVLVILGGAAAIAVTGLFVSIERTKAQAAKNNLLAISAAQQKYFEDYGYYCVQTGCGDTTANLYAGLRLDMTANDPFGYSCVAASPYSCTASDGTVTLILNPNGGPPVSCTKGGGYCPS